MKQKMNVLFIAPYDAMCDAIRKIALSYPAISLTSIVGNEDAGRKIAIEAIAEDYDCIVSRGNTATLIRQSVSIPVIEVRVTLDDVLSSLSVEEKMPQTVAAVGYRSVVSGMKALSQFLPFSLEIFGFDSTDELSNIFTCLRTRGIKTLVCDSITYQEASREGFSAYILQSGDTAYHYALDQVMFLYQSRQSMLEENQLLRRLNKQNSESGTVVFSQDHRLYYSSLSDSSAFLLDFLQNHLQDFDKCDHFHAIKRQSGYQYRISAQRIPVNNQSYYAYFISRRMPDVQSVYKGIRYAEQNEVRGEMNDSVFRIANLESYYTKELDDALGRNSPVLIFGEVGVGKTHLAELIYLNSKYAKNPFVFIDFTLTDSRTWNFLINKNDSPLCDSGSTLFLKNIDALDSGRLLLLLAALEDSEAQKRNRILISCSIRKEGQSAQHLNKTMYQLSCLPIHMFPLREQYRTIENSVQFLLQHFQSTGSIRVQDITPGAMELLLHYTWPHNYLQLIRVIKNAAILASGGKITSNIVSDVLTTEMYFTPAETEQTAGSSLDLSKSLSEINADIVRILLEQKSGNQTLTAKSLGISRTTLWRILKSGK